MDLIDSLEDDFIHLVEFAPIKSSFHRGAKLLLGENYREDGRQIIQENAPNLMEKFESYFDADEKTTQGD